MTNTIADVDRELDRLRIGQRIRALREARGMTMQRMADRMGGASISSVQRWERGDAVPEKRLLDLCRVLGVSAEHLLYGERPLGGESDLRTQEIQKLLSGDIGGLMQPHEKEGLALALRDTDADASTVALLVHVLYAKRGKKPR